MSKIKLFGGARAIAKAEVLVEQLQEQIQKEIIKSLETKMENFIIFRKPPINVIDFLARDFHHQVHKLQQINFKDICPKEESQKTKSGN